VIAFETRIRIDRSADDVFAFLGDPRRFPQWNSAVRSVDHIAGPPLAVGSRYSMQRDLPTGRVHNELEIIDRYGPGTFGIRTTSGPTPFVYRYRVSSDRRGTVVELDARVELPGLLAPLAARAVRRGVDANLAALKRILEDAR
jgi:carbon monoxide dehydrogenase subunit G